MLDQPSRPSRIFVTLALVGLAVVLADVPARVATALGAEGTEELAAYRDQCAAELTEAAERSQLNRRLIVGLIEGLDTLPESAALMASTWPHAPPAEQAAAELIISVATWMDPPSPHRQEVLRRLLREYRQSFGQCPATLAPLEDAVKDPSAAADAVG